MGLPCRPAVGRQICRPMVWEMPLLRGRDDLGWGGADHHLHHPMIFHPLAVIRSLDGLSAHGLSHERGGRSNVQPEDGRATGEHYHLPRCLRVRG
jgi:hypothetical protein